MSVVQSEDRRHLVLICKSNLERECLLNGLSMNGLGFPILCYDTIEAGSADHVAGNVAALILHIGAKRLTDFPVYTELKNIRIGWDPVPVILLSEHQEWEQVVRAIELGARGYIPTSVSIRICVEAVHLAMAGGTFIPATSITGHGFADADEHRELACLLTSREIDVVHLLKRGKANKTIAYDLKMSEGTVKVHIHNIMKKIGASNRTEVACKLNNVFNNLIV